MLYDAAAVTAVIRQAAPGVRPGAARVQSTTVGVHDAPALAALAGEVGLDLVEAPVSGAREPAEAGQLLVIAAGPEAVRERVAPVLDAIGARTVWTGQDLAAGSATRLKLVVNTWVIAASNAAGEVLALANVLGVDPAEFFNLINGGGLDLPFLRTKAGLILDDRLERRPSLSTPLSRTHTSSSRPPGNTVFGSTVPRRLPRGSNASPPRAAPSRTWPRHTTPVLSKSLDRPPTENRSDNPRPAQLQRLLSDYCTKGTAEKEHGASRPVSILHRCGASQTAGSSEFRGGVDCAPRLPSAANPGPTRRDRRSTTPTQAAGW
jgi:hypothetical protein